MRRAENQFIGCPTTTIGKRSAHTIEIQPCISACRPGCLYRISLTVPPHNEFIKRMSPCRETKLNTPIPACMRRWLHYVLRTRYFIRKNWVSISGDVFLRCCHTFMKLGNSFFSSPLKRYKKNTRHGKTRANTGKHGISAYCPFSLLKRWGN